MGPPGAGASMEVSLTLHRVLSADWYDVSLQVVLPGWQSMGLSLRVRATPGCGDGVVDVGGGEACDPGDSLGVAGLVPACPYGVQACIVCSPACEHVPGVVSWCGDGVVDVEHEECDPMLAPVGNDNGTTSSCDPVCHVTTSSPSPSPSRSQASPLPVASTLPVDTSGENTQSGGGATLSRGAVVGIVFAVVVVAAVALLGLARWKRQRKRRVTFSRYELPYTQTELSRGPGGSPGAPAAKSAAKRSPGGAATATSPRIIRVVPYNGPGDATPVLALVLGSALLLMGMLHTCHGDTRSV